MSQVTIRRLLRDLLSVRLTRVFARRSLADSNYFPQF
jgi:hypothetical protein